MNYRKYPTALEVPHRDTRKKLRKQIFEENKLAGNRARAERRKEKKGA